MFRLPLISLACLISLSVGCHNANEDLNNFPEEKVLDSFPATQFVPTLEERATEGKNVIYAVSFLLAWDKLRDQVGAPILTSVPRLQLVNQSRSYKNVLDSNEYTGNVGVVDGNITIHVVFNKSLSYVYPMETVKSGLAFKGKTVRAFGMPYFDENIASEIKLLYYKNDDEFILELQTLEKEQEVILAKGFVQGKRLDVLLNKIQLAIKTGAVEMFKSKQQRNYSLQEEDVLIIPVLRFNLATNYADIKNTHIKAGGDDHLIEKAYQRTAFLLNEYGAKVESRSELSAATDSGEVRRPKQLLFDKPFVVLLKKKSAVYPYFMMKVDNTELMIPFN